VRRPPPVKFCKVDVNECEELAVEFRIPAVPAFVLIKNGIQVDSFVAGSPDNAMLADAVRFLREC
jgi:thioredoxin-like negative regulator of GroEL